MQTKHFFSSCNQFSCIQIKSAFIIYLTVTWPKKTCVTGACAEPLSFLSFGHDSTIVYLNYVPEHTLGFIQQFQELCDRVSHSHTHETIKTLFFSSSVSQVHTAAYQKYNVESHWINMKPVGMNFLYTALRHVIYNYPTGIDWYFQRVHSVVVGWKVLASVWLMVPCT